MDLQLNDMLNNEKLRCLFCNYLEYRNPSFLKTTYHCFKEKDIYNCKKFISKELYKRQQKIQKILK